MANNKEENLYELLGLDPNRKSEYSDSDIKKAFRKASLKYHPDKQMGKSESEKKEAEEMFKKCSRANEILSDADKKQKYDMFGIIDDGSNSGQSSGFDPFSQFSDFFGGFGGFGGGRQQARQRVVPGENVQMRVPLTIKDIYMGCTKKLKYSINVRCQSCHGTGGKTRTCPHCNGTGTVTDVQRTPFGMTQTTRPCPYCNATGEIVEQKCQTCGGSGFKKKEVIQEVTFPAGVQEGQYIAVDGAGNEAKKVGHPSGAFVAIAKWNFDTDRYSIEGANIVEKVRVPYEDCILGTKIDITLPNDKVCSVTISPSTTPNKRYSLRGKGLTLRDGYGRTVQGNYIIEIQYIIPTVLDSEEVDMLKKIHEVHNATVTDDEEYEMNSFTVDDSSTNEQN